MSNDMIYAKQQLASLLETRSKLEVGAFLVNVPGVEPEQEQAIHTYVAGCVALMRRFGDALHAATGDALLMDALGSDDHPELEVGMPEDFAGSMLSGNPDLDLRTVLTAYLEQKAGGTPAEVPVA